MLSSQPSIQKQLSEAISIIAENDFPQQWEGLLPVSTLLLLLLYLLFISPSIIN